MANKDAPHGFLPVDNDGKQWHTRPYTVDASNAVAIAKGDLVAKESDGNVTRAAAGSTVLVGTVLSVEYDDALRITRKGSYLPASTAGTVHVIDDPDVRLQGQADDGGSVANILDYRGENCDHLDAAPTQTGEYTGRSNQEIDISTHVTTAAGLKLEERYPVESNAFGSSTTDNLHGIWIVTIYEHFRAPLGGVGV